VWWYNSNCGGGGLIIGSSIECLRSHEGRKKKLRIVEKCETNEFS
jgi:hypothetical protein